MNTRTPSFPKKLLVDSMGDLLPDEIVHRKKMGFTFPWEKWLRNDLKSFCETRIQSLAKRPFINEKVLLNRWQQFLDGNPAVRWPDIWIGVVLENWLIENKIEN
jgi:asparagine synthase (glutamine-hydrolysing)